MKIKLVFIVLIAVVFAACTITPLEVTLPERIQSVYIPMCQNKSYQPGIEEHATNAIIEAFVSDGRINVVEKKYADAMLEVIITKYESTPSVTDGEDYAIQRRVALLADVYLWEPNETKPLLKFKNVMATTNHIVDPELETLYNGDPRFFLMMNLGNTVVHNVMYGVLKEEKYVQQGFVPIGELDEDDIQRFD